MCTILDWVGRVAGDVRGYVERALGEDGPVDRIHTRSDLSIRHPESARSDPSEIGGMVGSALKRLTLQEQARTRLAMRPLALLTAAQAPLSAGDLGHALEMLDRLDVDGEMVKISREEVLDAGAIKECCTGLIAVDLGSGLVTIARGDISQQMRKKWNDLFGPEETVRVARVRMAYLSLSVFSTGPCPDRETFCGQLEEYHSLNYASQVWGRHAREALLLSRNNADVVGDVNHLLGKRKQPRTGSSGF